MSDVATRIHSDASARAYTFERVQDVEPILDHNALLRSLGPQKSDWGRHVASIPNVIYERFFNEYNAGRMRPEIRMFGNPDFDAFVQRRLNDPEWSYLRVDK